MFDLRYHVASLAAVFIAIAVGIVIGVAIASGGEVEQTTLDLRERQIRDLNAELESERARGDRFEDGQAGLEAVLEELYPVLMDERLAGKGVALMFLGPLDGGIRTAVERTLTDSDAGSPVRIAALELPIDVDAINELLAGDPSLEALVGDARLGDLGQALAREFAVGGETPLWDLLSGALVEERAGALSDPVDSVVVARSWTPEPEDDPAAQGRQSQSEALLLGILRGIGGSELRAVGVETTTAESSAIDLFRDAGLSSVDDVDTAPGRLALALVLAGGDEGQYGTKESASDGVSPPIEPLTVATAGG